MIGDTLFLMWDYAVRYETSADMHWNYCLVAHAVIIMQNVIKIAGEVAHAVIIMQNVIKIAGEGAHAAIIVQNVTKIAGEGAHATIIVQNVIKVFEAYQK